MKKSLNICNIYILLWCIYSLQGVLYASGGLISSGVLLVLLSWSLCVCFKVNAHYQQLPSFIKAINIFLVMATIYGGLLMLSGQHLTIMESYQEAVNHDYLKNIYISMLPLYVFYDFTMRGLIKEVHIKYMVLLLLGITVVSFFRNQNDNIQQALEIGSTKDEFTNNTGYGFVALMPLLLFWHKKPIVQYLLLLVCIGFIIASMKRGAILTGGLCAMFFLYKTMKRSTGRTKFAIIILSAIVIIASIRIVNDMMENSDYFVYRLEATKDGDSSNRNEIYSQYYNHFVNESNPAKLLFGNGANATLKIGPNYAHNDWLELAINQGLLGIFIYIYVFVAMIKDYYATQRVNKIYAAVIAMIFITLFIRTLFSMSYSEIDIAITIALGYCLAQTTVYQRLLKTDKLETGNDIIIREQ